jgi:CheY-like chemotaxis protein
LSSEYFVILVEDDALVLMTTEDIISEAGFKVETATSAEEAIRKLEADTSKFCAVVTDIRLGRGLTGWDVARRARELKPSMPIVYASGDSAMEWAAQGVPGSIMLQKPYADAQLTTALANLVNAAQLPGTSAV